jgi:CO/xanthine dehydrogenase FAD-binding subunit
LISAAGERQVSLPEFITGPGSTCLRSDELLDSIFIPAPPEDAGAAFKKLGRRRALACSVVNAAALVVGSGSDVREARLALGAVAPTPIRCRAAEAALTGVAWNASQVTGAWERVSETIDPIDDVRASGAYRRAAAVALAKQVTEEAWRARKQ